MSARQKKDALDEIPKFLRRTGSTKTAVTPGPAAPGRRFVTSEDARLPPPRDLPKLPKGLRYSETTSEESGMSQKPGVVIQRWMRSDPTGTLRTALAVLEEEQERQRRSEERRAANVEHLRRIREMRPNPLAGLVSLKTLLEEMGEKAPRRRHAIAAVDAAKLVHQRYHFQPGEVTLAHVRRVLAEYKPPAGRARSVAPEFDGALVVRYVGKGNPKKEGSGAHARWKLLIEHSGRTVAQFAAAGGNLTTLKNAVAQKRAELTEGETNGENAERKDTGEVPRKIRGAVRGKEKKAAPVAQRKRDRGADAGGGKPKTTARSKKRS